MDLERLLCPRSIAIVGASAEIGKVGHAITKNILDLGYSGEVFLVNHKYDELLGKKCYKSLAEIETTVDLAIIVIPAKFVNDIVREAAEKIKTYIVISAGFSETGEEGKDRERALLQMAKEKNLTILGPNCLGFIAPNIRLNASFAGGIAASGNVAFVSQSGALAVALMDIFEKEKIGFSHLISVGNKMQVSEVELLEYLGQQPEAKVIALYLEGIKDGQSFVEKASRISKQKPIVVLKAGKTEKSQQAISSHTGALAGSSTITSVALKKAGILEAANLEEFVQLIAILATATLPTNNQVVVVTNAGGPGVLTTDAFQGKSVKLLELDEKLKKKLRTLLPPESSVDNPIDLLGDADEKHYKKVLDALEKTDAVGTIMCILTPQDQTPIQKVASKIIQFKNRTNKLVITSFIGGSRVQKAITKFKDSQISNFAFPEKAIDVLGKLNTWKADRAEVALSNRETNPNSLRAKEIIQAALADNRSALYFSEAKEIMDLYNIPTVQAFSVNEADLAALEYPVVLKVDSDTVLHKTDKQGLILNISTQEELRGHISTMRNNFPTERLIIQPMLERQVELIIGIKKDASFGPVVVYGLGGIYTEIFKMVNFLIPPLSADEIREALLESKIEFLFRETRGQAPYNIDQLVQVIQGVSQLAGDLEEIKEFDINPLLIYNHAREAVAVDVKIII